ncbi:MAG: HAD-IA family hydrolase [archaeon]|nr:HAD-IA family hydrolase [archaeon]
MDRLPCIKGLLFDLDGTLVSTEYRHREIVVGKTLEHFGKGFPSKEILEKFWFEGNRSRIIKEFFELDVLEFWKFYQKYDTPELRKFYTTPFKDVEVLPYFKEKGYKLGIVTSAPPEIAEIETEMIGKSLFDKIVVAHSKNGFLPKPNPDGIIKCLHALSLNNYEAIFIGNSDEDTGAARNASVTSVHLDRKEYKYENLNPDFTVSSLYYLKDLLNGN